MEKGYTAMILNSFLDGIKQAGASVESFYSQCLDIQPCTGEFYCWYEKPGECYIQDDMQKLYPKLAEADTLIIATPVYIPLPSGMQKFLNRLCPLIDPYLTKRGDRTRARFLKDVHIKNIVLVSVCGWWEMGNFDTVIRIVKEIAKDTNAKFSGAVLRPHAYLMSSNEKKAKENLENAKKAGYQLIKDGGISEETLEKISQPLISELEYRRKENDQYLRLRSIT